VLGWVYEEVDQAETEAALAADIAGQKTPVTTDGVPW
jgi:transcription antitermination factor NusG